MNYLLVVILFLLTIAPAVNAQEELTLPDGNVKVIFEPSPDERTQLHILYVLRTSDNELFNYHLPLGTNEKSFTSEELWGKEQYVFYATAASVELNDQSVNSNTLTLNITGESRPIPPEKTLPKKEVHIPPDNLRKD